MTVTPEQRAKAMRELDRLNKSIADTEYEIDCLDEEDDEVVFLESSLYWLKSDRHKLLQRFPEVRYWPQRQLTQQ